MSGAVTDQTPQRAPAPVLPAVAATHRHSGPRRRLTLLAGVSVLALGGALLPRPPAALAAGCSGPPQIINLPDSTPVLSNGAGITITGGGAATSGISVIACDTTEIANAGTISGGSAAVSVQSGNAIGTLTNTGAISNIANAINNLGGIGGLTNNASINGGNYAIANFGSIGGLTNNASIIGGLAGISNNGTIISLTNAASVSGDSIGIYSTGSIGTLSNSGTITGAGGSISGTLAGIANVGAIGLLTLTGSGSIAGSRIGIYNLGAIGTLGTDGSIAGNIDGIRNSGTIGSLTNGGGIFGASNGVRNTGVIGSLTNTGTIGNGTIGGATGAIYNSGTIVSLLNAVGAAIAGYFGVNTSGSIGSLTNNGTISGSQSGIAGSGTIGAINNGGTISGANQAAISFGGTLGSLVNTGLITGPGGVSVTGTTGTISNAGTIIGTSITALALGGTVGAVSNSGLISGHDGVTISGQVGSVANSGTISSSTGIANGFPGVPGGTLGTLTNSGTISAGVGIGNNGFIGTLNNAVGGLISSSYIAIINLATIGALSNSGTISGGSAAISNSGSIGTLTNAGLISGASAAIRNSGSIGGIVNNGTIQSASTAITNSGTLGALSNTGTISGAAYALYSTGLIGPIANSGLIEGSILTTGQDLSITGGSGIIFGALTGGTITVSGGNLNLSGNHLLQDNVTAGTVTNTGNLMLTAKQTITGNYAQTAGSLIVAASNSSAGGLVVSGSAAMADANITFNPLPGFSAASTVSYVVVDAGNPLGTSYAGDTLTAPDWITAALSTALTGGRDELILTITGSGTSTGNIVPGTEYWPASGIGFTVNPAFEGGTLRLDQPGAIYTTNFTVSGAATNTIDQYGNVSTFTGTFSDAAPGSPGNLVFINSLTGGEIFLNGIESYTGTTTIESGAKVAVNGSMVSAVIVAAGGTLRGTGTINGSVTVQSGGTVAPGNSPGTLTIAAPVTLAAGSSSSFDIDGTGTGSGAGNYSRLVVTSTLSAGGTLVPLLRGITGNAGNSYTPPIGQAFQVITASGGLTGSFSGLTQPDGLAANTRFDALYSATALDLVVTPASYAGYAAGNWAAPVGAGLDAARPAAGVALTAGQSSVYAPLYTLAAEQIVPALEQIAPLIYADALMVNRTSYQIVEGAVDEQLQARRGAPAASSTQTAAGPNGTTIWLGGSGQFVNQSTAANGTPGYSGSAGGVVAGIDATVLPGLRIGIAAGFSSQSVNSAYAASYQGSSAQMQVYAGYRRDILFVDAQAGVVFDQGTVRRSLPAVYDAGINNSVTGSGAGGSVRGGVRLAFGAWNVEPSVTLSGLSLNQNGLAETGAGSAGLQIAGSTIASLQTTAAIEVDRRVALGGAYVLVPSVRLGWAYEALDTGAPVKASFLGAPGSGFALTSASIGRSAAVAGVHAVLETGTAWQAFAGYDAAFNSKSAEQLVAAGLLYRF